MAFCDSDDWYPDSKSLEMLYNAAKKHKAKVAGGSFSEYNQDTEQTNTDFTGRGHLAGYTFRKAGFIDFKKWQMDFGWIRFIYNRQFILKNNLLFPKLTQHEDPVWFVQVMLKAKKCYAIPDVVYRYRIWA